MGETIETSEFNESLVIEKNNGTELKLANEIEKANKSHEIEIADDVVSEEKVFPKENETQEYMQYADSTVVTVAFLAKEVTETAEENQLKEELCSNEATDLKSSETTEVNQTTKTSEFNESLATEQDNVIELKDTTEIDIANVSHESAIDDDKVTEEDLQKAVFIETKVRTEPTPILNNGQISI